MLQKRILSLLIMCGSLPGQIAEKSNVEDSFVLKTTKMIDNYTSVMFHNIFKLECIKFD